MKPGITGAKPLFGAAGLVWPFGESGTVHKGCPISGVGSKPKATEATSTGAGGETEPEF